MAQQRDIADVLETHHTGHPATENRPNPHDPQRLRIPLGGRHLRGAVFSGRHELGLPTSRGIDHRQRGIPVASGEHTDQ